MKKAVLIVIIAGLTMRCTNGGSSTQNKLDSIGNKLDSSAGRLWDSTKEKARELKDRIEQKLEKRDSAGKKADTSL
jgi:hypothetical protein